MVPLASPASGIIYSMDPALGVPKQSNETFGPMLADRGETIGAHKLFIAYTFQHFEFNSIDGIDLKKLPIVFNVCDANGQCGLVATTDRLDVKVNQFAVFGTYGVTSRLDFSVAVPFISVRLATRGINCTNCPVVLPDSQQITFNPASASGRAGGIGDVVFRAKYLLWKGERMRLAMGADFRAPTGDELNFLGTGTPGVKPFAAVSWRGRIAPHVNVGYQWNGDSRIAGNTVGTKGKLPDSLSYIAGVDFRAAKKLTVVGDFLGERVFDAERVLRVDVPLPASGSSTSFAVVPGSFNTAKGAFGVKVNPIGTLLVSANVLLRFDHNGLRNKPVPLAGVSYTF